MELRNEWIRVTDSKPCPVCGKTGWCARTADGINVHCMRIESDKPCRNEDVGGWIHRMSEPLEPEKPQPKKRLTIPEIRDLAKKMYEHKLAADTRAALAAQLGVSVSALDRLRVGYGCDHDGRAFASFPSRNSKGEVIGITRRYQDGGKKTYPGTTNGLFMAPLWMRAPGPMFIPEGGSDVAAFMSAGLCAIGRPSNVGGVDMLRPLVERERKRRRVYIVGERDEKPEKRGELPTCQVECKGCAHCYPGLHGAKQVSAALGVGYLMPPPAYKDFRDYWRSGGVWVELITGGTND